jgi:hypothetical protein
MRLRHLLLQTIVAALIPAGVAAADGGPIMPLSQVHPGMNCIGETVVQGTTISSFNVQVIDLVQDPTEGARILISVSGPAVDRTGVAEGFSGSPVYCDNGSGTMENIGAISEGVGEYGNKVALVTPIQVMLGEPVRPPAAARRTTVRGRPLVGPLSVGGLSPGLFHVLQAAGQKAGRTVLDTPAGLAASFPVQPLVPGAAVATSYGAGAIPVSAIGTVTYRDGTTVYAFGHPLDGAGRRSLLLQDAYVYYVVNNPNVATDTSYKLAVPGHTVGTLTSDTPNAVIGSVGAPPRLVPVDVTARDLDTGKTLALHTTAADETDVGMPLGSSIIGLIGPLEVAQAATQIYDGAPANESGRLCLTVTIRELRRPLHFCNRYVSTGVPGDGSEAPPALALAASGDAGTALGLIDQVQFAPLHVTHVSAQLDARRGLREAVIVSAHAPLHVQPGERVAVRLLVRAYRATERHLTVHLRIPADARGPLVARIVNSASAGQNSGSALASALTSALSGSISLGPPPEPPATPAALAKAFAGVSVYDGLTAKMHGEKSQRIYRDPSTLITGSAKLTFVVSTGHSARHHHR